MLQNRWIPAFALLALLLQGCEHDMSDLQSEIADIKSQKSSAIDPIPQMKPYQAFYYERHGDQSPFKPFESYIPPEPEVETTTTNQLKPDFSRNREPLEEFPLDGLSMLGLLEARGERYALVSSPDGVVHRVTYGDHMGQNFGRVVEISALEVVLEEIVPDGFGGYVKRPAVIAVRESET